MRRSDINDSLDPAGRIRRWLVFRDALEVLPSTLPIAVADALRLVFEGGLVGVAAEMTTEESALLAIMAE